MGNSASNRRVTVVNDDVVGVVEVSESVIRRIRKDPNSSEPVKETTKKPQPPSEVPPPPTSSFVPFSPPEIYSSTLEQRQKYHEEFKKAERSWRSQIDELESQNLQLFEATKEKFAAVLTEVEDNHVKNSYAPVCPDKQQEVLKCYKENPKHSLKCSQEVHEFMNCVDKVRMTVLSK